MSRSKLSAGLYLVLVFVSGALVGAFAHRLYTMNSVSASTTQRLKPEDFKKRYMEEMRTRLKLNSSQEAQLSHIMDVTRDRFRQLHDRTKPQLDAIKAQEKQIQMDHRQDVRAMLTDLQRVEYEKMLAEREKHRQAEAAKRAAQER